MFLYHNVGALLIFLYSKNILHFIVVCFGAQKGHICRGEIEMWIIMFSSGIIQYHKHLIPKVNISQILDNLIDRDKRHHGIQKKKFDFPDLT